MIRSSVNLDCFISVSLKVTDSTHFWRKIRGSGQIRSTSFMLHGEAVLLGVDGISATAGGTKSAEQWPEDVRLSDLEAVTAAPKSDRIFRQDRNSKIRARGLSQVRS